MFLARNGHITFSLLSLMIGSFVFRPFHPNWYPDAVVIGDGVWISTRAIILKGVQIGDGAVIAAGAVVTRSVPEQTLVAGVSARILRRVGR
jgi:acetyltransferase-like isoleucine patch superfamily enzyme